MRFCFLHWYIWMKKIENPIHLHPLIQFGAVGEGCGSLSQLAWSKRQGIPRTDRQSVWANRERERERQPFILICELSLRERARTSVIQEWLKVNPLGIKWVSWGGVTGVSGMCNPEVARRIVAFNWLGNTLVFLQKCWRQVGRAGHFYLDCCPLL